MSEDTNVRVRTLDRGTVLRLRARRWHASAEVQRMFRASVDLHHDDDEDRIVRGSD
jgi:hypothetical protein